MKTYRYAILPLFALGLAFSSPVLAGEGDSPNVPNDEMNSTSSSEAPKLPFEKDPDGSGTDQNTSESTAGSAPDGDSGESASTGSDGADSGDASDGSGDGGEG